MTDDNPHELSVCIIKCCQELERTFALINITQA